THRSVLLTGDGLQERLLAPRVRGSRFHTHVSCRVRPTVHRQERFLARTRGFALGPWWSSIGPDGGTHPQGHSPPSRRGREGFAWSYLAGKGCQDIPRAPFNTRQGVRPSAAIPYRS